MPDDGVILSVEQVEALLAEMSVLTEQLDTIMSRRKEITGKLVASGEARLRQYWERNGVSG